MQRIDQPADFRIQKVTSESEIYDFLSMCSGELSSFRYFSSRELSIFESHVFTYIVYDGNTPIAYYHLDREDQLYWFGICVLSDYQNLGIGKLCISHLKTMCRSRKISNVVLTTDLENTQALSLYMKNGFHITKKSGKTVYMKLKNN